MLTLNSVQEQVIKNIDQNVLVLAGAGTGKTRIIIAKIYYLLSREVSPREILAITFTNKAAQEMRNRIKNLISESTRLDQLEVRTFHSFGALILRSFIHYYPPYEGNFSILDQEDQKRFLKDILEEQLTDQEIKSLLYLFSDWKNKFLYPGDGELAERIGQLFGLKKSFNHSSFTPKFSLDYLVKIYRSYMEKLAQSNLVDFDDLIGLTVKLLRENRECYQYASQRWKYLLVDEYQDTNVSQEKLIEIFIKAGSMVTAVGDDSQSIYGFRGAHLDNILSFKKKYSRVKIYKLEENYRSTSNILNLANRAIAKNLGQFKKNLFSNKGEGLQPTYSHFEHEALEAESILQEIKQLLDEGESLNDISVLYRTNYQSRLIEEVLIRNQIPYQILGGLKFYERKEIKEIMSYLYWLLNPKDQVSFYRLINFPPRGIGTKGLERIKLHLNRLWQERSPHSFLALFEEKVLEEIFPKGNVLKELIRLKETIDQALQMIEKKKPLSETVNFVIHQSGIYRHYSELKSTFERDRRLGNIDALMDSVIYFEDEGRGDLFQFIEGVSLGIQSSNEEIDQQEQERMNLLTIHNAKGLEFGNVFLIGMEEGTFPHNLSIEENQIEEERRLFYVAITRAKRRLFLTSSKQKVRRGFSYEVPVSRFIDENRDSLSLKDGFSFDLGETNQYF